MIHVFSCSFLCVSLDVKKNGRTQWRTLCFFFFIVWLGYRSYSLGMDNEICVNGKSTIPLCDYRRVENEKHKRIQLLCCCFLIHNIIDMTKLPEKYNHADARPQNRFAKKKTIFYFNDFYTFSSKFISVTVFARHRSICFICLLTGRVIVELTLLFKLVVLFQVISYFFHFVEKYK